MYIQDVCRVTSKQKKEKNGRNWKVSEKYQASESIIIIIITTTITSFINIYLCLDPEILLIIIQVSYSIFYPFTQEQHFVRNDSYLRFFIETTLIQTVGDKIQKRDSFHPVSILNFDLIWNSSKNIDSV